MLIAFVILDYVTGLACAIYKKKLSSWVGFIGILRKIMLFVVVAVANLICVYVFDSNGFLRAAVIFFFIANEGLSILENAGSMGLPIPKKLLELLEQLKNKNNESEDSNNE